MDFKYLFTTLYGINVETLPKIDQPSTTPIIDILKYELPLRKVFYKFYPSFLTKYTKLKNYFSNKDLERALIADPDLICVPIELIDPNIIQTKTFDKLLSQDYDLINDFINYKHNNPELVPLHYVSRIEFEIHYNNLDLSNYFGSFMFPNRSISNNLEFYATLFGGTTVINANVKALDCLSDQYIIEYLNNNQFNQLRHESYNIITNRYINNSTNSYPESFWNKLSDLGKQNLLSSHIRSVNFSVHHNHLPTNSIATLHASIDFISQLVNYSIKLTHELIRFFEFNIQSDTYTGDWYIADPKSVKYKHIPVDNVTCKLNEEGVKMVLNFDRNKCCGYHVANFIANQFGRNNNDNESRGLYSTIILEEVIQYFVQSINLFDQTDIAVHSLLLSKCPIEYLHIVFHNELTVDNPEELNILTKIVKNNNLHDKRHLFMFQLNDASTMNAIINATNSSIEFDRFITSQLDIFLRISDDSRRDSELAHAEEYAEVTDEFITYYIAKANFNNQFFKLIQSIKMNESILHRIFKSHRSFVYAYLDDQLKSPNYQPDSFKQLLKQYYPTSIPHSNTELFNLGIRYIAERHEEPPLILYPSPNFVSTNDLHMNSAKTWSKFVNQHTVPKEMTSTHFYEYMIKCNGVKKNPEFTSCYSFFSNSLENKIIFVKADIMLDLPAVIRFDIPVPFDRVKTYLLEGIETNNITMFTNISDHDWAKISGGNNMIDCVALSDSKNIYRERTPLREVIAYLIKAIEIEFDIKAIVPDN